MDDRLQIVRTAAEAGAVVLRRHAGHVEQIRTKSSASDLVTEVDVASGMAIARSIATRVPGARFVIEEPEVYGLAAVQPGGLMDDEVWVIDPLDGTTSYVHGYPCYSVSVACLRHGRPVAGAVLDASRGEVFSAEAGGGAFLDGRPVYCAQAATISDALLITGFPYDRGATLDRQLAVFTRLVRDVHGIRRDGSAAIDCCRVACGQADGFWEFALKTWDTAAGALIAAEAGCMETDMAGAAWTPQTTDVLVANPRLHEALVAAIGAALEAGGFPRPSSDAGSSPSQ